MALERAPAGPVCRYCGKRLRPNYETTKEGFGQATGRGRRYVDSDLAGNVEHYPDGSFSLYGLPVFQDKSSKRFYRMENTQRILRRRWLGTYGSYGDGFFCGLNCGYRYGVRLLRQARRDHAAHQRRNGEGAEHA